MRKVNVRKVTIVYVIVEKVNYLKAPFEYKLYVLESALIFWVIPLLK